MVTLTKTPYSITLPNPQSGSVQSIGSEIIYHRALSGKKRTYVRRGDGKIRLSFNFSSIPHYTALELLNLFSKNPTKLILVTFDDQIIDGCDELASKSVLGSIVSNLQQIVPINKADTCNFLLEFEGEIQ